jgi:hypothetical protein
MLARSITRSQQLFKTNLLRTAYKRIHTQVPSSSTAAALSAIKEESGHGIDRAQVVEVIRSPYYNTGKNLNNIGIYYKLTCFKKKGTAMPTRMRQNLNLRGQAPATVETFQKQADRALKLLRSRQTQLEKYTFMAQLRNNNTRLFYKLINDHIEVIFLFFFFLFKSLIAVLTLNITK